MLVAQRTLTVYYLMYMGHETYLGQESEHEGERYLRLLGLDHLAAQQIPGRDIQVRDFLDVCGEDAMPVLVGLESLGPDDPRYGLIRDALREQVAGYLGVPLES